ncbi:exported hypothetical protein [Vibrio chagasii]|nr:exported hypothetical protein [Vibrio chagasii]
MKKSVLILASLFLTVSSFSVLANNNQTEDNAWERQADNKLRARVDANNSSVNGVIGSYETQMGKREVFFSLIWENKAYCQDKPEDFVQLRKVYVNGQPISFNLKCHENQWVNYIAHTAKGTSYIVDQFNTSSRKDIEFTEHFSNSKDSSFTITNKNFRPIYKIIEASTKDSL